jgi:hypothetical protein
VAGIRDAARLGRYLVVKRSLQVVGRSPHAVRFVVVMAEAAIAFPAQQAPHLAGLMTMIDVELATLLLANPTNAPLTGQKCVQIVRGDAVAAFLPARLDFVLVCYSPTLIYPEPFLSKFRVFGISRFLPNGLARNHVCFPPPVPMVKSSVKSPDNRLVHGQRRHGWRRGSSSCGGVPAEGRSRSGYGH